MLSFETDCFLEYNPIDVNYSARNASLADRIRQSYSTGRRHDEKDQGRMLQPSIATCSLERGGARTRAFERR